MQIITRRGPLTIADRVQNIHPDSWDPEVYKHLPFAQFPLTAEMDMEDSEVTDSYHFHWWEEPFDGLYGSVVGFFADAALSSPYASGGESGDRLYMKVSESDANRFLLQDTISVYNPVTFARIAMDVLKIQSLGDESWLLVELHEDDNSSHLSGSDLKWTVSGRSDDEIAELPESQHQEPIEFSNYTQHMMAAAELSNREIHEKSRVNPNIRVEQKAQALKKLNLKREYMRFLGRKKMKGKRTWSGGIYDMLKTHAPENIVNWATDTTFLSDSSSDWIDGSLKFTRGLMEFISRFAEPGEVAYGWTSGIVIDAYTEAVLHSGHYTINEETDIFGFTVRRITGLSQDLVLREHPLFKVNPSLQRSMCISQPSMQKTVIHGAGKLKFIDAISAEQAKNGYVYVSGEKCGWDCDEGTKMKNPGSFAWLDGLGLDR